MSRLLRPALALLVALSILANPASGCCDDFWSCAGAVATGGLSCAAEAAVTALQTVIDKLLRSRADGSTAYQAQLAGLQAETQQRLDAVASQVATLDANIDAASAEGSRISGDDQSAIRTALEAHAAPATGSKLVRVASPTPTPLHGASSSLSGAAAPPGAGGSQRFSNLSGEALAALGNDPSLGDLARDLAQLKAEKAALVTRIGQTKAQLLAVQAQAAAEANAGFSQGFVKPLDDALDALRAALANPLNVPGLAASVVELLDLALKGLDSIVDRLVGAARQLEEDAARKFDPLLQELEIIANKAAATVDKMRKMTLLRSAAERQALAGSNASQLGAGSSLGGQVPRGMPTPNPGVTSSFPAGSQRPVPTPGRALRSVASLQSGFAGVRTTIATLLPTVASLGQRPAIDVAPYRLRLGPQFDAFFRGKPTAEARQKRDELILEARRRFASDPRTLAAVVRLLDDEARARGIS